MKLDFGVVYRGLLRGLGAHGAGGEGERRRPRPLLEATRESLEQGHRRPCGRATASGTSGTRCSATWRPGASPWSGTSWATASAGSSTSRPRCRTTGRPGTGMKLRPGMVLAVEPMVNAGHATRWRSWTTTGRPSPLDGKLSAHFEHTILITETGPEVLTRRLSGPDHGVKYEAGRQGLVRSPGCHARGACHLRTQSVIAAALPRGSMVRKRVDACRRMIPSKSRGR